MFSVKKRLLALSVATAIGMTAGNVGAHERAPNGIGMYNIIPYYTVQNGFATVLHITNSDTLNGKAVKVRFRGAEWSDDVFDITVFLSPGDVWTAAVTRNGDLAALSTDDVSCTLPANVNADFRTFRLGASEDPAAGTREGYVEIITMADIPEPTDYDTLSSEEQEDTLYGAIKHVDGVAPCTTSVLEGLSEDLGTEAVAVATTDPAYGQGMTLPTGSLMSYAINIDVPTSKAFTNEAVAVNPLGDPTGAERKIYFAQSNDFLDWDRDGDFGLTADLIFADGDLLSAGPDVGGTGLQMFQFDMPDLTTPVLSVTLGLDALAHRNAMTTALTRPAGAVYVEYSTDTGLQATTDVVFNQPTRRFYYWYTYECQADTPETCDYNLNGVDVDIVGEEDADTLPIDNPYAGQVPLYSTIDGGSNTIAVGPPDFWDREEDRFDPDSGIVISPEPPPELADFLLKGEASVVSINDGDLPTGSLEASLTAFNYDVPLSGEDGWVILSVTGDDGPLPVIGFTAQKVFNGAVGTAGTNYGFTLPLRSPVVP